MTPEEAQQRLDRLRKNRNWKGKRVAANADFEAMGRDFKRLSKKIGGIGDAWAELCPPHLQGRSAIEGVNRGVLTIAVADHGVRHELDRFLRSGGQTELVRRAPITVRKVKLVVKDLAWGVDAKTFD